MFSCLSKAHLSMQYNSFMNFRLFTDTCTNISLKDFDYLESILLASEERDTRSFFYKF